MTMQAQRRAEVYLTYVDGPQAKDLPHHAKRKILADLWIELAEAGQVINSIFALGRYAEAVCGAYSTTALASEEKLDAVIAALRRKQSKPGFRRAARR